MRIVLAATGASGTIYLQRLLDYLSGPEHELHLVLTPYAKQVVHEETGGLRLPPNVTEHSDKSMNAPFASGSALLEAMIICPWSLIHARNALSVIEAGAILLPAMPSFYSRPKSFEELADTVVWRILDQIGIHTPNACRWQETSQETRI